MLSSEIHFSVPKLTECLGSRELSRTLQNPSSLKSAELEIGVTNRSIASSSSVRQTYVTSNEIWNSDLPFAVVVVVFLKLYLRTHY